MTKQKWVCKGKCRLNGGKPGLVFQSVEEGKLVGKERYFAIKANNRRTRPGAVYELEASGDSAAFSTMLYDSTWPDESDRLRWEAKAEEVEQTERANKLEKEIRPAFAEALDPIRKFYDRTDAIGRRTIESMVLSYLRH